MIHQRSDLLILTQIDRQDHPIRTDHQPQLLDPLIPATITPARRSLWVAFASPVDERMAHQAAAVSGLRQTSPAIDMRPDPYQIPRCGVSARGWT